MTALVGNHLWQSTFAVAIAALVALLLRKNRAHVRYLVWLTSSVKFLVPFPLLVILWTQFAWTAPVAMVRPQFTQAFDTISQPFSPNRGIIAARNSRAPIPLLIWSGVIASTIWALGSAIVFGRWIARWRHVAAAVRRGRPATAGRELEAIRRLQPILGISTPITIVSSNTPLEPGVFGIVRPVLLWPSTIAGRLTDRQLDAILAHELCHVRRRDNLVAAVHMLVETLFWFHPAVWWIGARLVDERERACDDEVVRIGFEPQVYAESIVKTCEFYVESPLVCVAGVTGSDLNQRIERIMRHDTGIALTFWRKTWLAALAVATMAAPAAVGALDTTAGRAQSRELQIGTETFATVTIRASAPGDPRSYPITMTDGRLSVKNLPLRRLIAMVYEQDGGLEGGPDWLRSSRFDIDAAVDGRRTGSETRLMVRKLLADRFGLVVHKETRELPIYELVLLHSDGTLGPRMRPSDEACITELKALKAGTARRSLPAGGSLPSADIGELPCGSVASRPNGTMKGRTTTMADLAFGGFGPILGRKVIDKTGLPGYYDFELDFTPAAPSGPPPNPISPTPGYGRPAPFITASFFTAVQEQLGLDLASQTGPVDRVVIDEVHMPSA